MPTVNNSLNRASRWVPDTLDFFSNSLHGPVEPYTLEDLYPAIEEFDPDTGEWTERKSILPHQQKFHEGISISGQRATVRLLSGGYGSGKSLASDADDLYFMRKYPGSITYCCAPFDWFYDEVVWPNFEKVFPFEGNDLIASFNRRNRRMTLTNGSVYVWHAFDDATKVRGFECHRIRLEEAAELGDGNSWKAGQIFRALQGRLRAKPAWIPREIIINQNPAGHNYLWKMMIQGTEYENDPVITVYLAPGETIEEALEKWKIGGSRRLSVYEPIQECPNGLMYKMYEKVTAAGVYFTITFGTAVNPHNPPGYLEQMLDTYTDPLERQRLLDGEFNPIHSIIFEGYYNKETHFIPMEALLCAHWLDHTDAQEIPRHWPLYVGIDVAGSNSPWAIVFAVETPNNELVVIREIYKKGPTWPQIVEDILDFTQDWHNVSYWIDPKSANQRQGPNQESITDFFKKYDLSVQIPRGYNQAGGIALVRSLLQPDKREAHPYLPDTQNEETGEWTLGASRLYFACDPDPLGPWYEFTQGGGGKILKDNRDGLAAYWLTKEMETWRFDGKPRRETKEWEEGLEAPKSEKPVDRNDHACSALMFLCLGYNPMPKASVRRKRDSYRERLDSVPRVPYPATKRRPWRS